MNASKLYWLVLVSVCAAVNILFYTFTNGATRLTGRVKQELGFDSTYISPKMAVTAYTLTHQTGLAATLPPTASYKHPARQLKTVNRHQDPSVTMGDNRIFQFKITNYTACMQRSSVEMVIIVISKVDNFLKREAIRNTWSSVAKDFNTTVFFLTGTVNDSSVQSQVENEAVLYNDVIQVDIPDVYMYLTFKSISMLQWLNDYCSEAKYFLKADDDTYINIQNVFKSISGNIKSENDRFFLCHVFKDAPPIRDVNSKWYTPYEEYNRMFFPTYCSGTAYLFSSAILIDLYQSAIKTHLLTMEDVFLTGLAAENLKIAHIHDYGFSFMKRPPTGCGFKKAISGHEVKVKDMFVIFAQLFNNEIDCDTNENLVIKKAEEYG